MSTQRSGVSWKLSSWYEIGPDEAVLVEGTPPAARYWSLQIFNRWMESPDYRHLQVARNSAQVALESDGSFRVVICAEKPAATRPTNWIDTAGHPAGLVCFRALLSEEPISVKFRVVKRDELS